MPRRASNQRGVAMLLVVGVMAVMLLIAAAGATVFMGGLKVTSQDLMAKRALFCAEAGLAVAKSFFGQNFVLWDRYLGCNIDGGCSALDYPLVRYAEPENHRLQFTAQIFDNLDEPTTQDPRHDNDLTVIVQTRCTEPGYPPVTLQEFVSLKPSAANAGYRQAGGFAGSNNLTSGGH